MATIIDNEDHDATKENSFTLYGKEYTYSQIRSLMNGVPYRARFGMTDSHSVKNALLMGIDSHLEACFLPSRGDVFDVEGYHLNCIISVVSFPILLRRLSEGNENAQDLAVIMIDTLAPEE